MPRFSEIAKQQMDAIEKPALVPVGTYVWQIMKLPALTESSDKKWEILSFTCQAVEPQEDVDASALADFGSLKSAVLQVRFMFDLEDENSNLRTQNRLKTFLVDHLKMDPALSLQDAINACVNGRFKGHVKWDPDKRDNTLQANIDKTAAID